MNRNRRLLASVMVWGSLLFFPTGQLFSLSGSVPEYLSEVLDNGVSIVYARIEGSPIVTIQIRLLGGLSNEGKFAGTGISHLLEHLIFKGTENIPSDVFHKRVKALGGIINGSTGQDTVEFHLTVPNENFQEGMALLIEMVMQPAFTDEEFEIEKDVVSKEINMREDDPGARSLRLLFERAFNNHVYKYPILGYADLMLSLRREDIEEYHSKVYSPDRMVMGIAGGVPPEEAFSEARKHLEKYNRERDPDIRVSAEPRRIAPSVNVFTSDVNRGYMALGFHGPDLFSPDLYASTVAGTVLGVGNGSVLYRRIVKEKELLDSVNIHSITPRYPGLFVIVGRGDPEKLPEARKEILRTIEELKTSGIDPKDLRRAKNISLSSYLSAHETTGGILSSLTYSMLMTGTTEVLKLYTGSIEKVTESDVLGFMGKYINEINSTSIFIVPPGEDIEISSFPGPGYSPKENTVRTELDNGLTLIAKRRGDLPLVSVTFVTEGGLLAESDEHSGISNLTSSLMLKGTKQREESEISAAIEMLGGSISSFSGMNTLGVRMNVLEKNFAEAMDIFQEVLMSPVFPQDEIEKMKRRISAAIKAENENIFTVGSLEARKMLYGDHPYSRRKLGEEKTVSSIEREDVLVFYEDTLLPSGSVLTVVGNIDTEEILKDLSFRFGDWEGKQRTPREHFIDVAEQGKTSVIHMPRKQSLLMLAFQGVSILDERKYPLSVISSLLSGPDGVLFRMARETEGLAYSSGAANVAHPQRGYFYLYMATTEENAAAARKALLEAVSRMRRGEIEEEDILASKTRIESGYNVSLQTNAALSNIMALEEIHGLGANNYREYPEKIKNVTVNDIIEAAETILDPERGFWVEIFPER